MTRQAAHAPVALAKFDNSLEKRFEKLLEDFDEAEYRQFESLWEPFGFLDYIVPPETRTRERGSESVTMDVTSDVAHHNPMNMTRKPPLLLGFPPAPSHVEPLSAFLPILISEPVRNGNMKSQSRRQDEGDEQNDDVDDEASELAGSMLGSTSSVTGTWHDLTNDLFRAGLTATPGSNIKIHEQTESLWLGLTAASSSWHVLAVAGGRNCGCTSESRMVCAVPAGGGIAVNGTRQMARVCSSAIRPSHSLVPILVPLRISPHPPVPPAPCVPPTAHALPVPLGSLQLVLRFPGFGLGGRDRGVRRRRREGPWVCGFEGRDAGGEERTGLRGPPGAKQSVRKGASRGKRNLFGEGPRLQGVRVVCHKLCGTDNWH
ncbi:hypothetical protein EDB87DRAFT_1575193 [Lactarius vividus]|nr:hypothetical protein EDB87DRAFT_1575193 [Lactarius vividus]